MTEIIKRVKVEKAELSYKLYKLDEFIKFSKVFVNLDKVSQTQLIQQRKIMRDYAAILKQRLEVMTGSDKRISDDTSRLDTNIYSWWASWGIT